jgi:hypothetical protein
MFVNALSIRVDLRLPVEAQLGERLDRAAEACVVDHGPVARR